MKEKLYNQIADYYDLFGFSDYNKQSKFVSELIRENVKRKNKGASIKVLDLACGTGEHIKLLKSEYEMEGLDLNDGMIKVARRKNPNIKIGKGNLNDLKLKEESQDAIISLSSSLQYILERKKLVAAFKAIYTALKPGGICIFDLAYCKDHWQEGYVGIRTVVSDDLQLAEIFKSRSEANISFYNPIYLINNHGKVDFFIDNHEIFLYTIAEVKKIAATIFTKVEIFAGYAKKKFNPLEKQTPVFLLKK